MAEAVDVPCTVIENEEILPGVHRTVFRSSEIASAAEPGMFIQIEVSGDVFPVTRRPFTLNRAAGNDFEVIFDVVGRGTEMLSVLEPGASARVLGPLGTGWRIEKESSWLLIGGGLGAAGFDFLLHRVHCSGVLIGASSKDRVLPLNPDCRYIIATEDGSAGTRGLVTDILQQDLFSQADVIAVCGPVAMMEAVWNLVPESDRSKVQISTESRMGCGWGVCDGCSIPVAGGGYRKCCTEGPVFPGIDIDWKRWKEAGL